jgi:hypothetical protein
MPLSVFILGVLLAFFITRSLGIWLMLCAAALALFEQIHYEIQLERYLDRQDALAAAHMQREDIQPQSQASARAVFVVATGLAPDIRPKLARIPKRPPLPEQYEPPPAALLDAMRENIEAQRQEHPPQDENTGA